MYENWCKSSNSGTPHLGGEELDKQSPENYYEPRFVNLDDLDKIDIIGTEFINIAAQEEYSKQFNISFRSKKIPRDKPVVF